ncbi:accessory Sec system protein Asp2 [Pseudolactococcus yaeyamensis]
MAKKKRKNTIIQIGGKALDLPQDVLAKFNYVKLQGNYDFIADNEQLAIFTGGVFNPKQNRNLYVLGRDAVLLQRFPRLLEQLPAYQVFFDTDAQIDAGQRTVLDKRFAIPVALEDATSLRQIADRFLDYTISTNGYKLNTKFLQVRESFKGTSVKKGNFSLEMSGDFGQEMQQILSWKSDFKPIAAKTSLVFYPEIMVSSGDIELEIKIFLHDPYTETITAIFRGSPQVFRSQEKVIYNHLNTSQAVGIALYAKGGEGKIEIGQVHFREHLSDNSILIPGGKQLIDTTVRHEEILYYFHPGDLKPPLSVLFSTHRIKEGFDGRGMMGKKESPFLLISDPRLLGGNLYLGSNVLEEKVVALIKDKLAWLGFTNKELILSGISMGAFASLYYAADLKPAAVILGKLLTSLGSSAMAEPIRGHDEFGTSADMLLHFGDKSGNSIAEQAKQLDRKFWDKFEDADFNATIFAICYMKNDEYNDNVFSRLVESLRTHSPKASIIYKGYVGRHNDNTGGTVTWVDKQYRNILSKQFGRKIVYKPYNG